MEIKPLNLGQARVNTPKPLAPAAPQFTNALAPTVDQSVAVLTKIPRPEDLITLDEIDALGISQGQRSAQTSQKMLENTKASDVDVFGDKLNQVVLTAKGLDPKSMEHGGFLGKLKMRFGSAKEQLMSQHQSVSDRLNVLCTELRKHEANQRTGIQQLQQLRTDNETTHQQFGDAVVQGRAALQVLQLAIDAGPATTDTFGAQHFADVQRRFSRLEKKIDDLQRGQLMCQQLDPQIAIEQENKSTLISALNTVMTVMIPALTNAFALYVSQLSTAKTASVTNAMHDVTDNAIRSQADQLRANVQAVGAVSQRAVIGIDAFEHAQQQLFGAFDDMSTILQEGRKRRAAEAPRLAAMEKEMVAKFTKRLEA